MVQTLAAIKTVFPHLNAAERLVLDQIVRAATIRMDAGGIASRAANASRKVGLSWLRLHPYHLTKREIEVLELVCVGQSNKEIARELSISYRTVEVHRSRARAKIGVRNTTELLRFVLPEELR